MRRLFVVLLLLLLGLALYLRPRASEVSPKGPVTQAEPNKKPAKRHSAQAPQETTSDFEDDPAGELQLQGQVIDEEGKPLEGAIVGLSSSPSQQTLTNKEGLFSFDKLIGRTYYLNAHKDDLYGDATTNLTQEGIPVTIRMIKGHSAEITVLNEVDRSPIPNAELTWGWNLHITAYTDQDGKALLRGLEGWAWLYVSAEGYSPLYSNLRVDKTTLAKKIILLAPGAPSSGLVLSPEGLPVSGATIDVEGDKGFAIHEVHKITSDAQGRWSIPAIAAGTYRFSAKSDDFARGYSEPTTLDGKTPIEGIIIRLELAGVLSGVVLESDGSPAAGAIVSASKEQGDWNVRGYRSAYTDPQGKFIIKGMNKGPIVVGAKSVEGSLASPLHIDLSQGNAEGLILTLDVQGTISGSVVDAEGNPIAEARVSAFPVDAMKDPQRWRGLFPGDATSDPDGNFTITGVATEGKFSMSAEFPEMSFRDDKEKKLAKAGDTNIKLVLQEFGKVKGKVQFADGRVPDEFTVEVGYRSKGSFTAEGGGYFELDKIAPGKQTAGTEGPSFEYKSSQQFIVKPGELLDIGTIIVEGGRTVKGRVLRDGKPIANASVIVAVYITGSGALLEPQDEYNKNSYAITKEDGLFEIKGLSRHEDVTAIAEHPTLGRSKPIQLKKGTGDATVELILQAGGALEGVVSRAGQPIEGELSILDIERHNLYLRTSAGADGKYRFDFLSPGVYEVTAMGQWTPQKNPGVKTVKLTIEAGKTQKANIDIPAGVTVAFSITREGTLQERVTVWMIKLPNIYPKDTDAMEELLLPLPVDQAIQGFTRVTSAGTEPTPLVIGDIAPGVYTLCMKQDADEQQNMTEEERRAPRPVFCVPQTITASPAEQSISVELPAGY